MKAFPTGKTGDKNHDFYVSQDGMDLRDYFAGQVMPALVINQEVYKVIYSIASQENETPEHCLAVMAYHMADAMMKARNK